MRDHIQISDTLSWSRSSILLTGAEVESRAENNRIGKSNCTGAENSVWVTGNMSRQVLKRADWDEKDLQLEPLKNRPPRQFIISIVFHIFNTELGTMSKNHLQNLLMKQASSKQIDRWMIFHTGKS